MLTLVGALGLATVPTNANANLGDDVEAIHLINPLTGESLATTERVFIFPAVHYVADDSTMAASAAALSALVNLGYDRMEAAEAVAGAASNGVADENALIKAALQSLGRNL